MTRPAPLPLALLLALSACSRPTTAPAEAAASPSHAASTPLAPPPGASAPAPSPTPAATTARASATAAPNATVTAPLALSAYPWLADPKLAAPAPADRLSERFAPPPGFARVPAATGSFGAWLRDLPLAAPGTPVVAFDGDTLHEATDARIAAVAALDVGRADLQQCADAIMRLDAEWRWQRGERDVAYRLASGMAIDFPRYARGERLVPDGPRVRWEPRAKASGRDDHGAFRAFLDQVFSYANTGSLAKQAQKVALDDLRPGDFVVQPGAPGHAVLVLDMARAADGRRALLLGQSYMPAQSFQVLRPAEDDAAAPASPWFAVTPDGLTTPFWPTFAWSALRRLDG